MKKHKTTTKNWRNQLKVHSGSIGNMQQTQIQYVKRAMLQNAECEEMQVRQWTSFWRIKQMLLMSFLFFNHIIIWFISRPSILHLRLDRNKLSTKHNMHWAHQKIRMLNLPIHPKPTTSSPSSSLEEAAPFPKSAGCLFSLGSSHRSSWRCVSNWQWLPHIYSKCALLSTSWRDGKGNAWTMPDLHEVRSQ